MGAMKNLAYDLAEKYLEEYPDATWEEAMKEVCENDWLPEEVKAKGQTELCKRFAKIIRRSK